MKGGDAGGLCYEGPGAAKPQMRPDLPTWGGESRPFSFARLNRPCLILHLFPMKAMGRMVYPLFSKDLVALWPRLLTASVVALLIGEKKADTQCA